MAKRTRFRFLFPGIIAVLFWQVPFAGDANNNFFLPGDAFFHTVLTQDALRALETTQNPIFRYQRPSHLDSFFCGVAGFEQLEVKEMPPAIKASLVSVYRELRESQPLQIELVPEVKLVQEDLETVEVKTGKMLRRELNGFSMFFYNADFAVNRYRLALKYNETWLEEVVSFGHSREFARCEFFVREEKAIMSAWRDAQQVKPLGVLAPPIQKRSSTKLLPPITLTSKIRILVFPTTDFLSYYEREQGFYEVTAAGIQWYQPRGNGKWEPVSFEPEGAPVP